MKKTMTVKEILDWVNDEQANSLQSLKDEPNRNNNHITTVYSAEIQLLEKLKEFILE